MVLRYFLDIQITDHQNVNILIVGTEMYTFHINLPLSNQISNFVHNLTVGNLDMDIDLCTNFILSS
jgi:hypothetical protein